MKKLEYRILEKTKESVPYCNYCVISDDVRLDNAIHELVAYNESGNCADISSICADCKKDFENDSLPYCEECGRLKRNREGCFCAFITEEQSKMLSAEVGTSQTIESRLVKENKKLEKELKTAKKELKIEREEVAKFQEKSKKWSERQKKELIEENKRLKEENGRLKAQLEQQNQSSSQIEIKEPKK